MPSGKGAGGGQRDMEAENVGGGQDGLQGQVFRRAGLQGQGRVVAQDAQAEQGGLFRHARADLAKADQAEGFAGQQRPVPQRQPGQRGDGIFGHGVGVAAGGGAPGDAGFFQPGQVEVIAARGGRGNEFHRGVRQQLGAHPGLGPDNQGTGFAQVFAADVAVRPEAHFAEAGEGFAGLVDAGRTDDFHGGDGRCPCPDVRRGCRPRFMAGACLWPVPRWRSPRHPGIPPAPG